MTLGDGFPPFYPERPSSVMFEPHQLYLGYAAAALFVGLLLVLPGVRGRHRIFFLLRWSVSLFVGVSIIACVQGISWHEAVVSTVLPYRGRGQERAEFEIGLKIGLASYNITLKNNLDDMTTDNKLVFSEEFSFLNSDEALEQGLRAGLPFPILNVLEHFSVHRVSSQWMWGRRYWIAGHYSLYMLWSAFAIWVIANILLHTVVRYGGLMLIFTGVLMVGANAAFTSIQAHGCHLEVHIGYYSPAVLRPSYGWSFWLCLGVGLLCISCGTAIFIADNACSKSLRKFFNLQKEEHIDLYEVEIGTSASSSRRASTMKSQALDGEINYAYETLEEKRMSSASKVSVDMAKFDKLTSVKEEGDELSPKEEISCSNSDSNRSSSAGQSNSSQTSL